MLNHYYLQELAALRDLGAEFAETHPSIASMLSGSSADPDVERLLEGVAFLTGLIREKLDDDFPEIIHDLIHLIWPHYLRPLPSAAIVAFQPKSSLKQALKIKKGVQLASVPVAGTTCLFQTCFDVEVQPIAITDVAFVETPGMASSIRVTLQTKGGALNNLQLKNLQFHLAGDYSSASDKYFILRHYLRRIIIKAKDQDSEFSLTKEHLQPVGFNMADGVLPYPGNSFPGYRILQEYFTLPENFLFLNLTGLEKWFNRGEGTQFEIIFELNDIPFQIPRIRTKDFILFATPVLNLFKHEADPVRLDHRMSEYRVRPAASNLTHFQVYSVDRVTGYIQGTATAREYQHFDHFNRNGASGPVYNTSKRKSPSRRVTDTYISVSYPKKDGPPLPETLSIELTCTNGDLPDSIQVGDISQPTSSTPEFITFSNISPPTSGAQPPLEKNLLWRLLGHLSLNYTSLADIKNLKTLLGLYLFPDTKDRTTLLANQKRIDGLQKISSTPGDRLVNGLMMRGREIHMEARYDHFASQGDLYLFASILNEFLAVYSTFNSFTRFTLKESLRGEIISWPARIGERPLI
ncbi:type VI secretion protein, VC_A0110 family [Desulfocapsa sulfexigens DSM 10523]|uniref:Type VI secretion protein, VC_A0110 family n=1 Tax=Desulfocapsa sulfexigens (strain DSM 10523 / SB164P1) TaxID=1167006 RepID=M1PC87_DESSD|nr:type VI secretion system baseplate subunit TssF [Desulfocapsa sulfexigens]AGF79237.1 type VI secretion protein, VC_A0110 family [Desulfocapsa sulfexigens DSM 10523]